MADLPVAFPVDVLCVGQAAYDISLSVERHPKPDEKCRAECLSRCGGGPAANAAVTVARLGLRAAFAGRLATDVLGDLHLQEFLEDGVDCRLIQRQAGQSSISSILVKPGGLRSVTNFRSIDLEPFEPDLYCYRPKVLLTDGHEPGALPTLQALAREHQIPLILDAGSVHAGTVKAIEFCTFCIASETFALDYTKEQEAQSALAVMSQHSQNVIITLGDRGLVWKRGLDSGRIRSHAVPAIDTTAAGDVFHGAFAAGLAAGKEWQDLLEYSSAAAALACTRLGGRCSIPNAGELEMFLRAKGAE